MRSNHEFRGMYSQASSISYVCAKPGTRVFVSCLAVGFVVLSLSLVLFLIQDAASNIDGRGGCRWCASSDYRCSLRELQLY